MDELVAVGEEDAEAGMGVVPADHALAGVGRVHLLVDVLPGGVGEGQLGALLFGVGGVDGGVDAQEGAGGVAPEVPDQDAADLARIVGCAAGDDAIEDRLGEEDAEVHLDHGERGLLETLLVDGADVERAHACLSASAPSSAPASPSSSQASCRSSPSRATITS